MTVPTETRPALAGEIMLQCVLATLWGASYSFIKVGIETIPPITLIAGRTLIAGAVLLLIMRWRNVKMPRSGNLSRDFAVQAALNSVIPFTLIAWAEQTVDAGLATILNSTSPIFAFLLTAGITRHEAVTGRKLFGVACGLAGILLIIGLSAPAGLGRELLAQSAIVAATMCYAGAAIVGRAFAGHDPLVPAAGSMLAGAAVLVPLSLIVDRPWTLAPSAASLTAMAGLALLSTALAFAIYFRLIKTLGSVGVTAQAYLRVPIGVAISVIFLGESLAPTAWLGLICVVAGVAAMTLPQHIGIRRR